MAFILRCTGAVFAGMIVSFALVIAVEAYSSVVHPLPVDFKGTSEEMCLHVARYPAWVLATVVPAWAVTAFAGTWIAGYFGNRFCALFVGLILIAAVILNLSMLPYPIWFKISILLAIPAAVVLAGAAGKKALVQGATR